MLNVVKTVEQINVSRFLQFDNNWKELHKYDQLTAKIIKINNICILCHIKYNIFITRPKIKSTIIYYTQICVKGI